MFMVRGVAWALGLISIVAMSLSLLLAGRHLDVTPDLGPQSAVVLPTPTGAQPAAKSQDSEPITTDGAAPDDDGARADPRRAVPVEPHDEGDEEHATGGDDAEDAEDAKDRARDAADRKRDAAEEAKDAKDAEDPEE